MDAYSQQADMIPDNSQQGKVKHATLFLIFIASRYSLKECGYDLDNLLS